MAAAAQAIEKQPGEAGKASPHPLLQAEGHPDVRWEPVLDLGCDLTVELALPEFKIADLLQLQKGSVINAHWRVGQDVPLHLNAALIGWIEFEVVAGHLAVRLTELA